MLKALLPGFAGAAPTSDSRLRSQFLHDTISLLGYRNHFVAFSMGLTHSALTRESTKELAAPAAVLE